MKRQGDRPPRRPSLSVSLLLATILILPPAAPSQTTAPPAGPAAAESFSDTFDVNVVNVEVFVTDQHGQRVSGLTRDDFQILEDGKPVEITNFYAADVTVAAPGPDQESQGPAAPVPMPEEQRLQLGVFVDTSNLSERPRKRLQQELTTFLSTQLSPEDRVLLATYGKEGFKALPLRAGDPKAMKESVAEVFEGSPALSQSLMQLRSLIRQIERARSPFSGNAGDAAEGQLDAARIADALDSYSKQLMTGAKGSVEALDRFLSGLAGLPGRKAVL
ncbi:MAG TPA: VWA domain-containing protein, partial [Thermoanaerobaculia bacterium]|nr:VWA domain-containing protein [Thermoanaerobaculia bacterium]